MNISKTVVKHPKGTLILFLSIIIFGSVAIPFINKDLFPKIEYPVITIITTLENKSPQEIRNLVTVPMEEILSSTPGLRNMKSVSHYGESIITLYFDWGVNLDLTYMETREKLDFAKSMLPQGTSRPIALRFDPNSDPIMTIGVDILNPNIQGNERAYIQKNIKPMLERVEGVAFIETIGGNEKEIKVDVNLDKLYANSLSIEEVVKALEENNVEYPVGSIEESKTEYTVSIEGKIDNYSRLGEIVVGRNEQGIPIYLQNIAKIEEGNKEKKILFKLNGKEGVSVNVYKEGDANIVKTANNIREKLPFISEKTKKDLKYKVIFDNSEYIRNSINDIVSSAIIGIILTFIVLYLFLEDSVSSVIVGLAIPITVVMTIFFMYLLNISINLISLTGLSIGIGSMVDANIVIIENIKRYKIRKGDDYTLIHAANEVSTPVITSILTNIAVFLPIVFVQGIASSIFRELSLVVTFSHLSTLFTSILLTPALYKLFQDKIAEKPKVTKYSISSRFESIKQKYLVLLDKALDHSKEIVMVMVVLTFLSCVAFMFNRKEVLPVLAQNSFNINIKFPPNYSIDKTTENIGLVEQFLSRNKKVDYYYAVIGDYSALSSVSQNKKDNVALIKVFLKKGSDLRKEIARIKSEIGKYFDSGTSSVEENQTAFSKLFPTENEIYILGTPIEYLKKIADYVTNTLVQMKISNISQSIEEQETISLMFDRVALNNSGLNTKYVADIASLCLNGKVATKLDTPDNEEIDVNVKMDENILSSPDKLYKILLKTPSQENILISTIMTLTNEMKTTEINRYNQKEMVYVRFVPGKVNVGKVESAVKKINVSKNVNIEFSWDTPEIKKSINSLILVLFLSVIVIFVIIAFQFESIVKSLLILLTIPLIFIGLAPMLIVLGVSINVISLVGIILLVGIVVDNAIVMVDFYERNLKSALNITHLRKLVIEGSGVRFRPIVMTSLATIISLLPLILFPGEGMEFQKILSITIASGFFFSTAITLFFIPSIYFAIEKRKF